MNSLWTETAKLPEFPKLENDIKTDVLIIGGGIAGILCAYMLKHAGVDYTLVEAKRICSGITKNTTAKITSQHGLIYNEIAKKYGYEKAKMYLEANEKAVQEYAELCKNIDCDFERKASYVYSLDNIQKIDKELETLQKIGFVAEYTKELPLPIDVSGAVKFENQAQFHPLKFIAEISKGLNIYENTKVLELTPKAAVTNSGKISAQKIIVATHFPFITKHGSYFIKMYQHRSYALSLRNAPNVGGMFVDEADKGMSFRNFKDFLIVGGGDHRTGKKGGNWKELENFTEKNYPKAQIVHSWATQDCMTLVGIPYIGQYSKKTPNFYVATGFNKWGITSAMVAAKILTDAVLENENPYAEVFSPSRSILHPQLAINAAQVLINMLTPTVPRCPHMGCALKYNKEEHSWDCPCHGSRFQKNGELIDNPATDDMKKR